jgi:hypothetical protein
MVITVSPTATTSYTLATLVGRCTATAVDLSGTATVTVNPITLGVKVFLEGPWDGVSAMTTDLNYFPTFTYIPTAQPYNGGATWPLTYTGTESAPVPNGDITDWVLVELRSGTSHATMVDARAGFLKYDGNVVDLDGFSQLAFPAAWYGQNYYVAVFHRNHLAVMSANTVPFGCTNIYDFTQSLSSAYSLGGNAAMTLLPGGKYGLTSGDVNTDEYVDVADWNAWFPMNGLLGYYRADMNLDSSADVFDPNTYWMQYTGFAAQVP